MSCAFELLSGLRKAQADTTAKVADPLIRNGMLLGIKTAALAIASAYSKAGDDATARDVLAVLIEARHPHEITQAHS